MSKLAVFDVFGTIYTPSGSVGQQYCSVIRQIVGKDVKLSSSDIDLKFKQAFQSVSRQYPNHGKNSQITTKDYWKMIIAQSLPDSFDTSAIVDPLYNHFSSKHAYRLYPDVRPTLEKLSSQGFKLAILSNSDSRTRSVLKDFGILKYFDRVILSEEIEHEKPSPEAYSTVLNSFSTPIDLGNVWYIGDSVSNDFDASIAVGWNAVLVDRSSEVLSLLSNRFQNPQEIPTNDPQQRALHLCRNPNGIWTNDLRTFPYF